MKQVVDSHKINDTFIGRIAELERLKQRLTTVLADRTESVFVCGDGGIGKTRLVRELIRVAEANGFLVLEGRASSIGPNLPFAPVIDALRSGFAGLDKGSTCDLVHGLPDLSRLFPELHLSTIEAAIPIADPELAKGRLFESIRILMERMAAHKPVVLFVDDLPEADDASLEWVEYLIRRTHRSRLLLIATCRSDSHHATFQNIIQTLERQRLISLLELRPLAEGTLRAMLHTCLSGIVDEEVVTAVSDGALGNPLFAVALVQSWLDKGSLVNSGGAWHFSTRDPSGVQALPNRVNSLIDEKVRHLDEHARDVLGLLSVSPDAVVEDVLQGAAVLDDDPFRITIGRLFEARLIVKQYEGLYLTYRIAHPMIKEVAQAALSATARRHYHRAMMAAWREYQPENVLTIAYHARLAQVRAKPQWMMQLFTQAGDQYYRMFAYALAADHWSEAIVLGQRHSDEVGTSVIVNLRLRRLQAWTFAGCVEQSMKEWDALSEQVEALGNVDASVHLHRVMAQFESTRAFHTCIGHIEAAYGIWDGRCENEDIAWMLSEQVTASLNAGDIKSGQLAVSRLRDYAERFPTPTNRLLAKVRELQPVLVDWERCYHVIADVDGILAAALQVRDESTVYDAYAIGGYYALNQGQSDTAIRLGLEGSDRMRERGMIPHELSLRIMTMCACFAAGQWSGALDVASYVEQQAQALNMEAVLLCVSDFRALLCVLQGSWREANVHLKTSQRLATHVFTGGHPESLERIDERVHVAEAAWALVGHEHITTRADRVHWSLAHGLHFFCRQLEGEWLASQSRFSDLGQLLDKLRAVSPDGPNVYRAVASYLEALAGVRQGDLEISAAISLLNTSISVFSQLNLPFERAKAELLSAEIIAAVDTDQQEHALAAVTRSLQTFVQLGSKPYAQQARRVVKLLGGKNRVQKHTRQPAAGILPPLSARELEIVHLVAEGLTNREIGLRLFLSTRTVDTHLLRVYKKLGVKSRTALVKQLFKTSIEGL